MVEIKAKKGYYLRYVLFIAMAMLFFVVILFNINEIISQSGIKGLLLSLIMPTVVSLAIYLSKKPNIKFKGASLELTYAFNRKVGIPYSNIEYMFKGKANISNPTSRYYNSENLILRSRYNLLKIFSSYEYTEESWKLLLTTLEQMTGKKIESFKVETLNDAMKFHALNSYSGKNDKLSQSYVNKSIQYFRDKNNKNLDINI